MPNRGMMKSCAEDFGIVAGSTWWPWRTPCQQTLKGGSRRPACSDPTRHLRPDRSRATTKEVVTFANDRAPDAYEKVVDRLLASPPYGEHLGEALP
jgi:hypothetical protein